MGESEPIRIGTRQQRYTSAGRLSGYEIEIWHDGLNEHRLVRDSDPVVLDNKVRAQLSKWSGKWARRCEQEEKKNRQEAGKSGAEQATTDAQAALRECEEILACTLRVDDRVDWEDLKDHRPYIEAPKGTAGLRYDSNSGRPLNVEAIPDPRKPLADDPGLKATFSLIDHILPKRKRRKQAEAAERFRAALRKWSAEKAQVEVRRVERRREFAAQLEAWQAAERRHHEGQVEGNARIDRLKEAYSRGEGEAIEQHAELVLNASQYPDWMQIDFELGYNPDNRILVVEYQLPKRDSLPSLRQVTYVASRDEIRESHLSEPQLNQLYEHVCYQIVIRTLHELFEADEAGMLAGVVFNGWLEAIDPATGVLRRRCILSVQALKEPFLGLNLAGVDPKACFKQLKGIAASKLAAIAPVQPLIHLDREDRRFVDPRAVSSGLDTSTNLAAMPWEDFEHLVRELFEREFASGGGEVRVTQASRDGGVDAIAFDPDPIRGGKIVIQAKRYTATVDVSAVRDLYGTVMNEGATKGILVTTADYGPDAYEFAKGKPLTLLNGGNLLHLLEKHGHSARIDIMEARRIARDDTK